MVRDQTDEETIYTNIPAQQEDVELNEEQLLEVVAGGCTTYISRHQLYEKLQIW